MRTTSPETRAKLSAAHRGKRKSPEHRAAIGRANRTHGISKHPLSGTWENMHQRCSNPKNPAYERYGGRGITVCLRWSGPYGFPNFLDDMGERPDGKTLDREDNDGNYEPGNCRWATTEEQAANRRAYKHTCPNCGHAWEPSNV